MRKLVLDLIFSVQKTSLTDANPTLAYSRLRIAAQFWQKRHGA
jgi:hypothetical protein